MHENSEIQQIHRGSRLDLLGRHSKGKRSAEELADIKTGSIKNTKAKEGTTEGKHLARLFKELTHLKRTQHKMERYYRSRQVHNQKNKG